MSAPAYECTFRHVAFVLTSICVLMVAMFAGIAAAVTFIADGDTILSVILYLVGAIVVLVILAAVSAYATHRWTIEADRHPHRGKARRSRSWASRASARSPSPTSPPCATSKAASTS